VTIAPERPKCRTRRGTASPAGRTAVARPVLEAEVKRPVAQTSEDRQSAPAETGALEDLTAEESAWIAKWLDRSPEWSAEKWDRMGQLIGVTFS
jgi:hypothetical protein